jgi:hypothetical protein
MIAKISSIAKPFIKFNSQKAYELFMISILVGNPSSASLIIKELEYKSINNNEANKLLKVCSFFNPLFIISVITIGLQADIIYSIIVIISIVTSNIIIGFLIKNKKQDFVNNTNKLILFNPEKILISISDCLYLLLNVAGIMVFSNILKFSIENIFSLIKYHNLTTTLLISSIEVSTGALDIIALNLTLPLSISMLTLLLSFQGVSINLQVFNTIKNHNIRFYPIFITRLIQSVIAFSIAFILSNIILLTI